ncbi:MAG: haloacid dehalogenase-like hydrolase [Firmicutes bacterium]|nr:haloacid dehalogenase-like hydrolase [Bacillota bacterium]
MIDITMPDNRRLQFAHVVFDYNGTLAEDGITSEAVKALLQQLAEKVHVAVITADTFGLVREQLKDVKNIEVIVIGSDTDGKEKARYVQEWGAETTVVVGNGVNDQPMFFIGALKIAVLGPEGVSSGLLAASTIVVKSPEDAIRLLLNPKRLIATLRH